MIIEEKYADCHLIPSRARSHHHGPSKGVRGSVAPLSTWPRGGSVSTPAPRPLTSAQASHRLQQLGPNTLPQPRLLPLWRRILRAVRDPLVLVLLAAIVLTSLTGDVADTIVIAVVIVVNTTLAVRQEISADQAVSALARLVAPVAMTRARPRPWTTMVPE